MKTHLFKLKHPSRSLTYATLRALAHHNRMMRRNGYGVAAIPPSEGWSATYDVLIRGRRFTLWSKPVSSSACAYAITINARIRFVDRSAIFATALAAWEAITGIRYLGIYRNGSPVYGHRDRVVLIRKEGVGAACMNYTRPILRTNRVPARSYGFGHDPFHLAA